MRLHLDPKSPYPFEVLRDEEKAKSVREEIRRFRESQRLHLVVNHSSCCDSDNDFYTDDLDGD